MIRRTSGSSIVVTPWPAAANGAIAVDDRQGEGVERADLQAGQVAACGPRISSWARLLNATRQTAAGRELPVRRAGGGRAR